MKIIRNLLLSVLLMAATNASMAATYDIGELDNGYTLYGPNWVDGSFLDKILFSIDANSSIGVGTSQLSFSIWGVDILNISNLSQSLFTSNDQLILSGLNFSLPTLTSGNYYLQISGNGNGIVGGLYAGAIGVVALPVPEPDIWSSLMAGFLMVGFMAYRRRNSV